MAQIRTERIERTITDARAAISSDGPVVIGPWLGEVGFELLYWIPFLRWLLTEVPIQRKRLVVLSRGGCAHWYADLADTYVEIFDHISPGELRVLNRERIAEQASAGPEVGLRRGQMTAKQYGATRAEGEILRRVGLDSESLLHPSLMYGLFRLFWQGRCRDLYGRCALPMPMPRPAQIESIAGPYVAVKFYSSRACHDGKGTTHSVQALMGLLADVLPVVALDSGDRYDDHGAFLMDDPRITVIRDSEPSTNLAMQTAVIAHASAFVGTYGGFAYLAPMLGVPTTAVYSDRNFRDDHLTIASRIFTRFDVYHLPTLLMKWQRGVPYAA